RRWSALRLGEVVDGHTAHHLGGEVGLNPRGDRARVGRLVAGPRRAGGGPRPAPRCGAHAHRSSTAKGPAAKVAAAKVAAAGDEVVDLVLGDPLLELGQRWVRVGAV